MRYIFKIRMTKVPGGFKPTCSDSIRYILTNPAYIGAWVYKDAIVISNNHPAIVDRDLFLWSYHKLTGRNLQGELLENTVRRRLRDDKAQAVLKYLLYDPAGPLYVMRPEHPEYLRQTLHGDPKRPNKMYRDITFSIRAHLIDDIFLARLKALALADQHLAAHIAESLDELEREHVEAVVSIDDQLDRVRLEIQKTLAFLHDEILTLTPKEKAEYNEALQGLRDQEQSLLAVQKESEAASLKADFEELSDVLADIPGRLDSCSMGHKQKLARLVTQRVTIEEVSVHWLRFTVVWRGPLADRPDVCLIWRQRGRRSDEWTAEEDVYIKVNYATGDKWTMLEALPRRSWNMIFQRALALGERRRMYKQEGIPDNITVDDLNVIPDRELALEIVSEAAKPRKKRELQAYGVWLYSAGLKELSEELTDRNAKESSWPNRSQKGSRRGHFHANQASICQ
jgi:Recombinase